MLWSLANIVLYSAVSLGSVWLWEHNPSVRVWVDNHFFSYIDVKFDHSDDHVIANRFTVEHITNNGPGPGTKLHTCKVLYLPLLKMDVKYRGAIGTEEGIIVWDLVSGEMLMDLESWTYSHGLEDCLISDISHDAFLVLSSLSKKGKRRECTDVMGISKDTGLNYEFLDALLRDCTNLGLVVSKNNGYALHIQNPRLPDSPLSSSYQNLPSSWTTTQSRITRDTKIKSTYTVEMVQQFAMKIFGPNFIIKRSSIVYLPLFLIQYNAPDGSLHTTYYNAFSGYPQSYHQ